jgi:hypothetical protein
LDVPAAAKDAMPPMLYCPTFHPDKNMRAAKFPKMAMAASSFTCGSNHLSFPAKTALNHASASERDAKNPQWESSRIRRIIQQALGKRRSKEPLRQQGKCSLKTK